MFVLIAQPTRSKHVLHTCDLALSKLPCRRSFHRVRIVRQWPILTSLWILPRETTRPVCCVGVFWMPYSHLLSSLLSESPVWRNLVAAEGIVPLPIFQHVSRVPWGASPDWEVRQSDTKKICSWVICSFSLHHRFDHNNSRCNYDSKLGTAYIIMT